MLKESDVENLFMYNIYGEELLLMERVGEGGYVFDFEDKLTFLESIDEDCIEPIDYDWLSKFGSDKIEKHILEFAEFKAELQK